MKVYIGKPTRWIGPYQIASALMFWKDKDSDAVHRFGEFLAHGFHPPKEDDQFFPRHDHETWLYKLCLWIDKRKKQKIKVRIDRPDTWNFDVNIAYIILPMLKQVKERKQGAPFTDDEDAPVELRSTTAPEKKNEWDTDGNHFKRWDWILDEMIWAFEQIYDNNDYSEKFYSGESDLRSVKREDGLYELVRGPNDTHEIDMEGLQAFEARLRNGFRLFGKYLHNLSD